MKTINVFNDETFPITITTGYDSTHTIQPKSSITIQTDERFNSDSFFVNGDYKGFFQARYLDINNTNDLSLSLRQIAGHKIEISDYGFYEVIKVK